MKALTWHGKKDLRVEIVPDPKLAKDDDVIVQVTSTAICGSDLHIYNGFVPTMQEGDVLGHEFMGRVVEKGRAVRSLKLGDRVIVPCAIACGGCRYCERELYSLCDNTNPNGHMQQKAYGAVTSGLFGYSHMYGGYAGGQAEYVRVPFANEGPVAIPDELDDESVLFLTDILPTAWMAAENLRMIEGDTVAIWGCGPVGQLAIQSAWLQGAGRVIAIDQEPSRLGLAGSYGKAETLDFGNVDVVEKLREMCDGRGPDHCIDAVGLESHGSAFVDVYDRFKQAVHLEQDRPHVLRQTVEACCKGGTVSVPGVYTGAIDKFPFGIAFSKGLTLKMGQTHFHRYTRPLLKKIQDGELDARPIITHRMALDEAPKAYELFDGKEDGCVKVVLKP